MESNVLAEDVIEMTPAEADEVIQAFSLERPDPRFCKVVRIRRLDWCFHDPDTRVLEQRVERQRKLRIAVTE
ncbi:MAG: hypothetical protein DHS20C16_21520 [Phycisphaerae bacterium]|nr:MAG: hypothetical protein DHS20C16_21520 [Phycisphaerae bacterium]